MTDIGILVTARPINGGTFQYTLSMIEALYTLREHRFTIYSAHGVNELHRFGLPIVPLPGLVRAFSRAAAGSWRASGDKLFTQVEKVIAPIYSPYLALSNRPYIFTLHDLQEKYYPEYFTLVRRTWRNFWNRKLLQGAQRVICESEYVKGDIVRFFRTDERKIAVVQAPPLLLYREKALTPRLLHATRQRFGLANRFLFYPAQYWPHKNHLRLVEAFARVVQRCPDCQLVLTGEAVRDYRKVFTRVRRLGLENNVRYLGYLETVELAAVYRMATVVVVPTLFESISIPIYEAFCLGRPVCASRVVGLPEQVRDAGLLFDPESVEDMAEKMTALLEDTDLRDRLGRLGRQRVLALTHERYAAELNNVLSAAV